MTARPIGVAFAAILAVSVDAGGPERLYRADRPALGTTVAISVYAADSVLADVALEAAFAEIERVEQLLSDYRPTSELSRINRLAASGPVTVDPELFGLLDRMRGVRERTLGAFDPAIGSLVDAWGFRSGDPAVPSAVRRERARIAAGMDRVALDPARRTVTFASDGTRIDAGAFGKGYAVDHAARVLGESGIERALVNAGASTFRALGAPPGEPGWIIRLEGTADTLFVAHAGLSVSGQSRRRFVRDGVVFGHIIDPRTGYPAPAGRMTAVIAPDATGADALSTALYVLGPDQAASVVASDDRLSVLVRPGPSDSASVYRWRWPAPTPH